MTWIVGTPAVSGHLKPFQPTLLLAQERPQLGIRRDRIDVAMERGEQVGISCRRP